MSVMIDSSPRLSEYSTLAFFNIISIYHICTIYANSTQFPVLRKEQRTQRPKLTLNRGLNVVAEFS